jgi:membrane fusion protein, heavy metal efflux system
MKNLILIVVMMMLAACGASQEPGATTIADGGHGEAAAAEPMKGPHRGRLLTDGDVTVELAVFESGVPPEFHVYATQGGKPVPPGNVKLSVDLKRLDGKIDRFSFVVEGDYLKSTASVQEPHSFDVSVVAEVAGKQHRWTFSSYEGRTTIANDIADAAGIKTSVAGPGVLRENLSLYGSIVPNAERLRSVTARFPGPIRAVSKQIGDVVKAGDVLATIESNESLQTYTISAPIAGVITQRRANVGEVAAGETLFVISDYSNVWAELTLFAKDRARAQVGQPVTIKSVEGGLTAEGIVRYIAPSGGGAKPTLVVRVELDNADGRWTPGLFVNGDVTIATAPAELVVANSGLQSFRDFTVVFARVGETYEVRMLELGRSDGVITEVLGGLEPGTTYVSENSYLIKADIEKSGASHDH